MNFDPSSEPLVTAVVATYNEARHILICLDGILNQTGLDGPIEILVIDGDSSDATVDLVKSLPQYGSVIRLIRNPRRFQVYAWNIGIREARGKFVAFFSAHTEYSQDFIASCLEVRSRTGAANVGGVCVPVGDTPMGRAVAWAMQSPFGIGNSRLRYASSEQFADSVYGAFVETSVIRSLGGYDETIPFNEDSEMNYRLWEAGYTVFLSPRIKVLYHARPSLGALARQMSRYGFWRRRTQLEHPRRVPLRTYAPAMLLLGLVASLIAYLLTLNIAALSIPAMYGAFLLMASVHASLSQRSVFQLFAIPFVLVTMHLTYGAGWWAGFLVHKRRGRWTSPFITGDPSQPAQIADHG